MNIVEIIEKLGYPVAVSAWLMWFVSAYAGRLQRLIEWAIAVKHQIDTIEQNTARLLTLLQSRPTQEETQDDTV